MFFIEPRDELGDLLLRHGRSQINIPGGQTGESFRVAREQAVQEGGTAAQVAEDEERFFDGLGFVGREEDVVEPEEKPVEERTDGPDQIEQCQKDNPFSCEAGRGILGGKERAIECAPKQAEVVVHEAGYPLIMTTFSFGVLQSHH